jgi:hypothetical protein
MKPHPSLPLWRWAAAAAVLLAGPAGAATHTAHSFAVTESGAATLSIPIQVPRGIGGMEPQLALNYSSQAGNGVLGLGWNLSGPSAITRCPKARAIDSVRGSVTFSAETDRFCMDGQRLELLSGGTYGADGSTYVTERDSFSVITAVGSFESQSNVPASFRVETKAGLILHFGLSDNSRARTNLLKSVRDTGRKDTVNRWMLQRIADLHGSFVEFVYCGGEVSADGTTCAATENTFDAGGNSRWPGSKVLRYIQYTNTDGAANGSFAVVLRYEARPDSIRGYHAGSVSRQTQRVTAIQTYRGFVPPASGNLSGAAMLGTLVRSYDIAYDPETDAAGQGIRATNTSRISTIQERNGAGETLPALVFTLPKDLVFGLPVMQSGTSAVPSPPLLPPSESCDDPSTSAMEMCP